ncbi:hypothetical protein KBB96_09375 [Luteolibacter ambystomatis]|uniref:Uncharacterized protein n=1 Tax=Luteolibacter ambystomatis TaxID=2824561 RepID=A0A975J326_9BACT|nr:hypothetical protein [Luteolibacter ambystomatis]QUE53089.1 hypothetical protein KBB96_09375 [Luteolibacter ambystomatis]
MTTLTLRSLREQLRSLETLATDLATAGRPQHALLARARAAELRRILPELSSALDVISELRDSIANGDYDAAYDRAEGFLELHQIACGDTARDLYRESIERDLAETTASTVAA